LYNTLIGLGRYDDAFVLYKERINLALLYRLGASRQQTELLEMLFLDGLDQVPRLSKPDTQAYVLHVLAQSVRASGQPEQGTTMYRRSLEIDEKMGDQSNMGVSLNNLSNALRFSGALHESEVAARQALLFSRQSNNEEDEVHSLFYLGLTLAARGKQVESAQALDRSLELAHLGNAYKSYDDQAMRALWFGEYIEARRLANQAMAYAQQRRFERGIINAARLQGEAALGLDDLAAADERLHHALVRARAANLIEEELPALIGLAELRRRQAI
jgi:tetratricopeptide (TPR) repeat protein